MNRQARNSPAFFSHRMAPRTAALYAVCTVLAVAFLFPILWSAITSVKSPAEASAVPPTFLPSRAVLCKLPKIKPLWGRAVPLCLQ